MNKGNFKTDKIYNSFFECHEKTQELGKYIIDVTKELGGTCIFTETKTTGSLDKALKRVSNSHETGRALDQRTWNLKPEIIPLIIKKVTEKYGHIGAMTKTGERKLAVRHDSGHGDHIHWQLDSSFSIK